MRRLLVLGLVLLGAAAHAQGICDNFPECANAPAQCCNVPQAAPFMAYESSDHNAPIFRGIVPAGPGACAVVTDIDVTTPLVTNGPLAPVSVTLAAGVTLDFNLGEGVERWVSVGGQFDGGACFTPEVTGFHHPNVQLTVTDGCGDHVVTIGQPAFFCVTPTVKFVCFKSKNVNGNVLPVPVGFDRAEDVCAVFS
jgi:hypothetical protein